MFYLFTKQKQTHKLKECLRGRMKGRDSQGIGDRHAHTALFKMNNQQGPVVQHMELGSMLCGSLDGRGHIFV